MIGDSSQEMPVLRGVLLSEVDHDASSKPLAWSQDDLGTDANSSSEPSVFREVASRHIDKQVGAEPQRLDGLPQEIMESSQGGGTDQAYRSLVVVHDLSLTLDRDATGEHLADSLMPCCCIGGEPASVGQLDERHRITEMPAEREQARHPSEATGVLPAAQLPVCVPHGPQTVTNQSPLVDLDGGQLLAE